MLTHIRRDEALRPWRLGMLVLLSAGMSPVEAILGFWVYWFPLVVYLIQTWPRRRLSQLDLALPLPARRLWLARVLALGLGGAVVLAGTFVVQALLISGLGAGAEKIDGALRLGAGWVIAAVVLQSRRPALVRTLTRADDLVLCGVVLAVPAIVLLLDGRWVIALLALALTLGYRTWRSLPPAFTLAPLVPGEPRPTAALLGHPERRWIAATGSGGWRLGFGLLRSVWGQHYWLWALSFALGLLVGTTIWKRTAVDLRVLHTIGVSFTVLMFALLLPVLPRLAFFDPLPVRRGSLFAALFFPTGGAVAFGCGVLYLLPGREVSGLALPSVLLVGGVPGLLFLAIAFRAARSSRGAAWLGLGRVVGVVFLLTVLVTAISPAVQGVLDAFLPLLGEGRSGTPALWLVAALLLAAGYALVQASFERSELPALLALRPLGDEVEAGDPDAPGGLS